MILGIIIVSYHIISYHIKTCHIRIHVISYQNVSHQDLSHIYHIHNSYMLFIECLYWYFFFGANCPGTFLKPPLIEAWAELFTWFSLQRRYLRKSWRPQFFNPMGRFVVVWVFPWSCCKNLYKCPNKGVAGTLKLTAKAPENWPSQKETNIPTIHFQGRTVSFREGR